MERNGAGERHHARMEPQPESRGPRFGPLLAALTAAGLIGVVALWAPLGPTSSGPDATVPSLPAAPDLADGTDPASTSTTATAARPEEAPGGIGSTATTQAFPPPHPPGPIVVETALGTMRWEALEVPLDVTEASISAVTERPDGTLVVLGTSGSRVFMLEEHDGMLRHRRVEGVAPGHYLWRAVSTPLGLATASVGPDGPAVWVEGEPGVFARWELELPEAPAWWLRPQVDFPLLVATPSGLEAYSGFWGWLVDWPALVGAEYSAEDYWSLEDGAVVRYTRGQRHTAYDADLELDGDRLGVRVTDRDTGATVADVSVVTEHAGSIHEALQAADHAMPLPEREPLRWVAGTPGTFVLAPAEDTPGRGFGLAQRIMHTGERYLAVATVADGTPEGSSSLLTSDDGVRWTDITPDLGVDGARISDIVVRGDQVGLLAHVEGSYEIAQQVSVRGTITSVFVSDDLETWHSTVVDQATGNLTVDDLGAGPLGWVATGRDCDPACRGLFWVSPDGREWTKLDLSGAEFGFGQGNLYVGTDRTAWPSYSDRRNRSLLSVGTVVDSGT